MHYLIFLPNKQAANRQHLVDAGLGDLLREGDETPLCSDLIGNGPGEQPGQVWSWGDAIPVYLPDRQTWVPDKLNRFWLGTTNGDPVKPDDVMRKKPINGLTHRLSDGNDWLVPNIANLPSVFELDNEGNPVKAPHPRYREFVEECGWAFEATVAALNGSDPEWRRALDFCCMAISLNYRMNRTLVIMLGLLEEETMHTLMAKCTDTPRILSIIEELKKKAALSIPSG